MRCYLRKVLIQVYVNSSRFRYSAVASSGSDSKLLAALAPTHQVPCGACQNRTPCCQAPVCLQLLQGLQMAQAALLIAPPS